MARKNRGAARADSGTSALERDLAALIKKHADHSIIRETMEKMPSESTRRVTYTTYPACHSSA